MKSSGLQETIVAHLRAAGRPESSRDLARRFLRIEQGGEETCRLLLAPLLRAMPGVVHDPGVGWTISERRAASPGQSSPESSPPSRAPGSPASSDLAFTATIASIEPPLAPIEPSLASLVDFVALASDGAGPGGSGETRAVCILPVLAGEPCAQETFPAIGLEVDGAMDLDEPAAGDPPSLERDDLEALAEAIGDLPVVCHRVTRELAPLRRAFTALGVRFQPRVVSAARLGHLLLGLKTNHAAIDLAAALGLETRGPDDCRGRAELVAGAYLALLPLLAERGVASLDDLLEYQGRPRDPIDLSPYSFTADDLRSLPARPGVYRFLDRAGAVLYVGKSKNLRARVSSYFSPSAKATAKGRAILEAARSFAIQEVASELEAALVEAALIAECHPRLNRQFEVHERPAPYGPRLNLALVLPDASPGSDGSRSCTVHLLRGGRYLERFAGLGAALPPAMRRLLARAFFPRRPLREADTADHDIDWQLIASYLRKRRDEVNVLDLDECASPEEAQEKLRVLIAATTTGSGRVLAR
jgi:GIY-YIG catalytic domain-containing protein